MPILRHKMYGIIVNAQRIFAFLSFVRGTLSTYVKKAQKLHRHQQSYR